MGKRGHTEEEILRVLREAEAGSTVVEVCLTLHADTALSGEKVATALDKVVALRAEVDHGGQRN